MSTVWREPFDPARHVDHFYPGGARPRRSVPAGVKDWAYFVRVCGFTFEFASVGQIRECLAHYSRRHEPSSRLTEYATTNLVHEKGEWETWSERVPLVLRSKSKRPKVVKALERAVEQFDTMVGRP